MPSIREMIKKIDDLPTLPSVVTDLIELTSNPDSDIKEIVSMIEKDQALTAKLLRLCNSSYYGLSKQVTSLRNAVVLLGFKTVYKMVVALGTAVFFKTDAKGYGLSGIDMWRHALGAAIAAEITAASYAPNKVQSAYTAGLLHDIGKLVLTHYLENDLEKVLTLVKAGKTFVEAEQEVIGMDHGFVGGKLARQWKFPDPLVEAIKYHHEPSLATSDEELVAFAHVGNVISNAVCLGIGQDSFSNSLDKQVFKKFNFTDTTLKDIMDVSSVRVREAEALISDMADITR